jgi:DNA-binding GntR family transcriptional regulator
MNARTLRPSSLVDTLHAAVQRDIFDGRIGPDTVLTENYLAAAFNVARPTAKAALDRLTQEGLLRRSFNRSARVPLLDADDVRDLYSSRAVIERDIVRRLAADGTVPVRTRRAHDAFQRAIETGDIEGIVVPDIELHLSMVEAVESPRRQRMYSIIIGEVQLCMAQIQARSLLSPATIGAEHETILRAIEAGDPDQAAAALDAHLDLACQGLLTSLAERKAAGQG